MQDLGRAVAQGRIDPAVAAQQLLHMLGRGLRGFRKKGALLPAFGRILMI